MRVFKTPHELKDAVGADLGETEWLEIDQNRINTFAEATGDHQWIHVDEEKAKEGPYGSTIAHGYLTVSLVNHFLPQILDVQGRLIQNFVFRHAASGIYETLWDGRTDSGIEATPGVYFYRLVQGREVVTRRLVRIP